ncbi:PP2C family protein-serine/threonine phosphatase [Treponema sp. C6A8]|uniref:PP2C family protein-serine/threonine phosphatase n=1 Tax=Treponema sp. C6A8 TaxID=1410609 RepID=UPI000687DB93|nr:PP2C family protein-serine/threonine phosphatase [Treponema sp. C6A8]
MVYILLNIFLCVQLFFIANIVDRRIRDESYDASGISVSLLLCTVEAILFTIILVLKDFWLAKFTAQLMRLVLILDSVSILMLSSSLLALTKRREPTYAKIFRWILYLFIIYINLFKVSDVVVRLEDGVRIISPYLFDRPASDFFPIRWYSLQFIISKIVFPVFCYLGLQVAEEDGTNQLHRYRCSVIGEGIILMWGAYLAIQFLAARYLKITLLFEFPPLLLFVIISSALNKKNVPSARGLFVGFLRILLTYILPAAFVGVLFIFIRPQNSYAEAAFLIPFLIVSVLAVLVSFRINDKLSSMGHIYTSDYEDSLETDLAGIDYAETEMDLIAAKVFNAIKKNVENTSMTVYIIDTMNTLGIAYTTANVRNTIQLANTPVLENLLNINKTVVSYEEVEDNHFLSDMKKEIYDLFAYTKSDAFIILAEGHTIFGLICLGKKVGGDHFTARDSVIFSRLYSNFFVFGYYMRNIANKDIMTVVNREIRMSSQIITSIQENIDTIKNPKVDIGYLMVPSHNIGGEFIDVIRLTDKRYLFVVGDLSGKGIAASMSMVILKSIIRSYLAETHNFKQLVVKLNEFVRNSLRKGTIFAGLFMIVDFDTDTMYYINCGIPALFSYTQVYNNVIEIQGSGHVLGFVKDISPYISVKSTKLNRGDILLACTDGLLQSHSLRGEQFGRERVQRMLIDNSTYPAQRMTQFTFDALKKFMQKEMEDDVSILILKYETAAKYVDEEAAAKAEAEKAAAEAQAAVQAESAAAEVAEAGAEGSAAEGAGAAGAGEAAVSGGSEAASEETPSFFQIDNSREMSEAQFEEKQKQLDAQVAEKQTAKLPEDVSDQQIDVQTENAQTPEPEKPAVVVQHDAPPEGFDTSELDELDSLLSDIGL